MEPTIETKDAGSNLTRIAEYTETAAALADLRQRHQGVVYDVTIPKEMKKAKEARAEVKGYRVALEKRRVEIKAPALERCRLIDSEAKRITEELVALEEPLDVQIKTEEARAEEERLAKLEAERLRVEAINKRIDEIRNLPASLVGKPAVIIQGKLERLRADVLSEEEFAEHYLTARDAHDACVARVEQLLQAQVEAEAEQKRIAADRAELERMRAENERLQREADERAAAERAEADRIAAVERDRVAAEQRERDEAERVERQRQEDEARAAREEQERAEREEQDRVHAKQEAALQVERDRQAAEQKKLDEQAAKLKREQKAAAQEAESYRLANLGLREAAQAVVSARLIGRNVDAAIDDLAAALANDAAQAKPARVKKAANA